MPKPEVDYTLYVCTDRELLNGRELGESVEAAIAGGATLIQVREKNVSSREFYRSAQRIHAVTQKYRVPLIVNDRADIALAVHAEGLHIGQSDLDLSVARRLLGPDAVIGVSAGNIDSALAAQAGGADYIGAGPVFSTATKTDGGDPLGLEALGRLCQAVTIPVAAIGGITARNFNSVLAAGVDGVCVISAIWSQPDICLAAQSFRRP
jgi:thiamine-phosphate pyrophosphorylase